MPKKKNPILRRWLSTQRLISIEAILLVGLLEGLIEDRVMELSLPDTVKILLVMVFIAGAFGVLMSLVVFVTKRSLSSGHKMLKILPVSTSYLVLHGVAIAGIYWLYVKYY